MMECLQQTKQILNNFDAVYQEQTHSTETSSSATAYDNEQIMEYETDMDLMDCEITGNEMEMDTETIKENTTGKMEVDDELLRRSGVYDILDEQQMDWSNDEWKIRPASPPTTQRHSCLCEMFADAFDTKFFEHNDYIQLYNIPHHEKPGLHSFRVNLRNMTWSESEIARIVFSREFKDDLDVDIDHPRLIDFLRVMFRNDREYSEMLVILEHLASLCPMSDLQRLNWVFPWREVYDRTWGTKLNLEAYNDFLRQYPELARTMPNWSEDPMECLWMEFQDCIKLGFNNRAAAIKVLLLDGKAHNGKITPYDCELAKGTLAEYLEVNVKAQMFEWVKRPFANADIFFKDASAASTSISDVSAKLSQFMSGILNIDFNASKVLDLIVLVADIVVHLTTATVSSILFFAVRFMRVFNLDLKALQLLNSYGVLDFLFASTPVGENARAQGLDFNAIYKTVVAVIGLMVSAVSPTIPQVETVVKRCSEFSRIFVAGKQVNELLNGLLQFIPNVVREWLGLTDPDFFFAEKISEDGEWKKWVVDADKLLSTNLCQIIHSPEKLQRLDQLHASAREITEWLVTNPRFDARNFSMAFAKLRERIDDAWTSISQLPKRQRKTPFCIYIGGRAGVGKSELARRLMLALVPSWVQPGQEFYTRSSKLKHWDGYTGQYGLLFDDFAQDREEVDIAEIIQTVTCNPFILPMASLNDAAVGKKGSLFVSELVICCSNQLYPNGSVAVYTPDAVRRRRNILIEAVRTNSPMDPDDVSMKHLRYVIRDPLDPAKPPLREYENVQDLLHHISMLRSEFDSSQDKLLAAVECLRNKIDKEGVVTAKPQSLTEFLEQVERDREKGVFRRLDDEFDAEGYYNEFCEADSTYSKFYEAEGLETSTAEVHGEIAVVTDNGQVSNHLTTWYQTMQDFKNPTVTSVALAGALLQSSLTSFLLDIALDTIAFKALQGVGLTWGQSFVATMCLDFAYTGKLYETWCNKNRWWPSLLSTVKHPMFIAGLGFAVSALIYNHRKAGAAITAVPEYMVSGDDTTRRLVNGRQRKLVVEKVEAEGCSDQSALNLIHEVLRKRMAVISVTTAETNRKMNCFLVKGRTILAPYHLFLGATGQLITEGRVLLSLNDTDYEMAFRPNNLKRIEGKDAVLYELCKQVPLSRDISKHFVREDIRPIDTPAMLVSLDPHAPDAFTLCSVEARVSTKRICYSVSTCDFEYVDAWKYDFPTRDGQCGSPLVAVNTRYRDKILGIHVAGGRQNDTGFSIPITYEEILPFLSPLEGIDFSYGVDTPDLEIPQGQLKYLGTAPSIYQNTRTAIRNSDIFEFDGPAATQPANLRAVEGLQQGIDKSLNPAIIEDDKFWRLAVEDVEDLLRPRAELRLLTDNEIISGAPILGIKSVEMATSPGLPYVECGMKKKNLIDVDLTNTPCCIKKDSLLDKRFREREKAALQGKRYPSEWFNCLKDERRPLHKINSPRTFCVGPMDFNLLCKKYCGHFVQHFIDTREKHFGQIGIDVYSSDWDMLVRQWLHVSDKGFDGDYHHFDGKVPLRAWFEFFEMVARFMKFAPGSAEWLVYQILAEESAFTVTRSSNVVYLTAGSNPSGHYLTTVINCFTNAILARYVWYKTAPRNLRDFSHFRNNVCEKNYGDDNAFAVAPEVASFFNQQTFTDVMASIGIEYTDAEKKGEMVTLKNVMDFSFLKCKIREATIEGKTRYLALLSPTTIREMLYWIRAGPSASLRRLALEQNITSAEIPMLMYGEEEYEKWRTKVRGVFFERYGRSPMITAYSNLYADRFSDIVLAQGLDEDDRVVENKNGVTLIEADTPEVSSMDLTRKHKRAIAAMNVKQWDLKMMTERFAMIDTVAWPATAAVYTNLKRYQVPFGLLKTSIQRDPFNRFVYWRGKVRVRVQLNGSRFHAGRLIVVYVPLNTSAVTEAYIMGHRTIMTQNLHGFLDPSSDTPVELEIDFVHPKSYLSIADPKDFLGYLYISVFNQLQPSAGSTSSLNLTVMASVESEFQIPALSSVYALEQREIDYVVAQGVYDVLMAGVDSAWKTIAGKIVPSKIINEGIALMDKPANTLQPEYVTMKPYGYFNNAKQIEHIERLDLNPSSQNLCDIEHFGTTKSATSFKELLQKISFLGTATSWSTTQNAGEILASGPIYPCPVVISSNPPSTIIVTPVEYFSSKFTFWRGSLRYRFTIVSNAMQTGRLIFTYHYAATPPASSSILTSMSQYAVSFDVRDGHTTFDVEVPFLSDVPWKRIGNKILNVTTWDVENSIFFTGFWTLRVANPLISPVGAPSSVDINIFFGAGEDYQVSMIAENNSSLITQRTAFNSTRERVRPQGIETVNAVAAQPTSGVLKDEQFQSEIDDIIEIGRRYHPLGRHLFDLETQRSLNTAIPYGLGFPVAVIHLNAYFRKISNLMSFYYAPFALFRGSLRFKIVARTEDISASASLDSRDFSLGFQYLINSPIIETYTELQRRSALTPMGPLPMSQTDPTTLLAMTPNANVWTPKYAASGTPLIGFVRSDVPFIEFEIPMASVFNSVQNPFHHGVASAGTMWISYDYDPVIVVYGHCSAGLRAVVDFYVSLGDDTRFGVFTGVPPVDFAYVQDSAIGTTKKSIGFDSYINP